MNALSRHYKKVVACAVAIAVTHANAVFAAQAFQVDVSVTDALLKDRHSRVWKQNPSAENERYKYLIVGRRPDGAVMVLYQQPNPMDLENDKKIFLSGDFFKCGVKKDWPIFEIDSAADVKKQLEQPLLDDPSNKGMPISEGSDVAIVYRAVCRSVL